MTTVGKYFLPPEKLFRLSKIERGRYERYLMRNEGIDDRYEPKHPNRQPSSRTSMRNLRRWRNKKATGRYGEY